MAPAVRRTGPGSPGEPPSKRNPRGCPNGMRLVDRWRQNLYSGGLPAHSWQTIDPTPNAASALTPLPEGQAPQGPVGAADGPGCSVPIGSVKSGHDVPRTRISP